MNGNNKTVTHIELTGKEFTFYEAEEEVLLMPFFSYQVTKIVKDVNARKIEFPKANENIYGKVTTITLVEIPYTDLLEPRQIKQLTVIWYEWLAEGKNHSADVLDF